MKILTPEAFMNERSTGLIVRGFASKAEDVTDRATQIVEFTTNALETKVADKRFLKRVDVLIWANQNDYPGEADCGLLANELKKRFAGERRVFIHEVRSGDLFCSLLNYGIAIQCRAGCDYSIIASAEAKAYWSSDVPAKMVSAAAEGARAIGVAINELTESVWEGRIANTMAMWHNRSLIEVGLFDLRAAKPADSRLAHYMKGADVTGNPLFYHLAGVEEMIPLARLVDLYGKCIKVVESNDPALHYELPDPELNPAEFARNKAKFGTKWERQVAHLALINRDLSHIRDGVMA
jgi:hypothetical protein